MATTETTNDSVVRRLPDAVPPRLGVVGVALAIFVIAVGLQFGFSFLGGLVIGFVAVLSGDPGMADSVVTFSWVFGLGTYVIWAVIAATMAWWLDLRVPVDLPDARGIAWGVGGLVLSIGVALLANVGAGYLGYQQPLSGPGSELPAVAVVGLAATFLLAGPVEEYLFRGVLQGTLRQAFSAPGAILGATLLFVPLHVFNVLAFQPGAILINLGVITVLGLLLGAVYEHLENLSVPIAIHVGYNAFVVALTLLPALL